MSKKNHVAWVVRPSTSTDGPTVTQLLETCYTQLLPANYEADLLQVALPKITPVRTELLTCGTWYVVQDPTTHAIVGCGGWTPASPTAKDGQPDVPHLRHFATDPARLRQGIARALWNKCQEDMEEYYKGKEKPSSMEVYSTLTAEPYYASLGFVTEKKLELPLGPDCLFPCLLMRRPF